MLTCLFPFVIRSQFNHYWNLCVYGFRSHSYQTSSYSWRWEAWGISFFKDTYRGTFNLKVLWFISSSDSLPGASDTSYSYKLFAVTEITWDSRDEPEKLWTAHVGSIVKDTTGVIAVNTFSLFCHLYKSTRRKFYSLTRECCNYLAEDKFHNITRYFSTTLEFLLSRGECPFVCIDTETLNRAKLLERHKFCVLELHSHFANYMQRSERTLECLDDVKLALKRSSVGSQHEESETHMPSDSENQELRQVQLCRCLYKAHFQFLLFCSTYSRLLEFLVQAAREAEVKSEHFFEAFFRLYFRVNFLSWLEAIVSTRSNFHSQNSWDRVPDWLRTVYDFMNISDGRLSHQYCSNNFLFYRQRMALGT